MKTETEIKWEIVRFLRERGAIVERMNAGRGRFNQYLHTKGFPDLMVIEMRHIWFCEVKRPGKGLDLDQKEMREQLEYMEHDVVIAHSVDDLPSIC